MKLTQVIPNLRTVLLAIGEKPAIASQIQFRSKTDCKLGELQSFFLKADFSKF